MMKLDEMRPKNALQAPFWSKFSPPIIKNRLEIVFITTFLAILALFSTFSMEITVS